MGLLVNPNGGTPDGVAVIVIENNVGQIIQQPQPEGFSLPVAPFRSPGGALVYDAEAHHLQLSRDAERLLAFGLLDSFVYVYDVGGDNKLYPKLIASVDLAPSGYVGPHDALELADGSFLVTMTGQTNSIPMGIGPGGMIRLSRDGAIISIVTQPVDHDMFESAALSIAINDDELLAYPQFQTHYYYDKQLDPVNEVGKSVVLFKYDPENPGTITSALQTIILADTAGNTGDHLTSPTFWPGGDLNGKEVLFIAAISSGLWALTREAGSDDPFVPQLIYNLPVAGPPPQNSAMHAITFGKDGPEYNKVYLTNTFGDTLHVLDMSNGLPPVGQYFSDAPGSPFPAVLISNPNIHWAAFDKEGEHLYTSNTLFSLYDWILCRYPPTPIRELRRYDVVDDAGNLTSTPTLTVPASPGYGYVKFELRNPAEGFGFVE